MYQNNNDMIVPALLISNLNSNIEIICANCPNDDCKSPLKAKADIKTVMCEKKCGSLTRDSWLMKRKKNEMYNINN